MNKDFKILWHFKQPDYLTPEEIDMLSDKIKEFHNNSLVIFSETLEITIIEDNHENT